ncbi:unnamed protein product [Adineta ricciae]|uniref:Uncharacterized protein n=1 Tax=Adineta ricciae TaxID=249248 RepID=A0A815KUR6_ADIRI|nr:unnamed protein product [Adineta ricciae]CAF1480622.1 unnamed protein product [Adineta ricciae]
MFQLYFFEDVHKENKFINKTLQSKSVRHLDLTEPLLRTHSIHEIKRTFLDNDRNLDDVVDYIGEKSTQYKILINELLSTCPINGSFQIQVTVDGQDMERFLKFCQINRFKWIYLEFYNDRPSKQLIASFDRTGTYPNIIDETKLLFKDFNVKRLKIKSVLRNDGILEEDIDYHLFCDKACNYFEFHYKLPYSSWEIERFCGSHDLYLTKMYRTMIQALISLQ